MSQFADYVVAKQKSITISKHVAFKPMTQFFHCAVIITTPELSSLIVILQECGSHKIISPYAITF